MKRFFSSDTPLFRIMSLLMELAELNVLFLLTSLPIITIGAAYSAMLSSALEIYTESSLFSARYYLQKFRHALKPAVIIWPIGLVIELLLLHNALFCSQTFLGWQKILSCGGYMVLFVWVGGVMQLLFFFLSRTEKWNRAYLKDCALLSLAKIPVVLLMLLLVLSPLTALLMPVGTLLSLLPIILLFWFSCPAYVCVVILKRILKPLYPAFFSTEL